jgi:hypothetical protein
MLCSCSINHVARSGFEAILSKVLVDTEIMDERMRSTAPNALLHLTNGALGLPRLLRSAAGYHASP